jgi:hypothetical protein
MLNSEKIKKSILDPDVNLSKAVIEYFNDSFSGDTEILNLALDRYASLKDDNLRYRMLKNSENLKLNTESLNKIISYLPDASTNIKYIFEELLCNADLSLLKQIDLDSLNLSPEIRISIENRFKLSAISTEMLFKELFILCTQDDVEHIKGYDYRLGNLIIRELALRNDFDEGFIIEALTKTEPEQFSSYKSYLLSLGAMRKITSLIPVFINCLGIESCVGNEASSALVRIGSKDIVDTIGKFYYYSDDDFKMHAIGVLENIKTQHSENLLLKLLREETDFTLRTILTGVLCKHGNLEAFTVLFNLIDEGGEDSLSYLDDYVYLLCLLNDEIIHEMKLLKLAAGE